MCVNSSPALPSCSSCCRRMTSWSRSFLKDSISWHQRQWLFEDKLTLTKTEKTRENQVGCLGYQWSSYVTMTMSTMSSKSFGRTTSAFLRSCSRCTWDPQRVFNQRTPLTPRQSLQGFLGVWRALALGASTSFQNPANLPTPASSKRA